jgi:AcrR family transcriptional regulator
MLPAGRGTPRDVAEQNQRERLFAALVANVASKGYDATRVADMEQVAGVSRTAFYRLFRDKEDCFLSAVDVLIETTIKAIAASAEGETPEARARQAFRTFIEMIASQPAAARMCFVDVYAAGPRAVDLVDDALASFDSLVAGFMAEMPGRAGMPQPIVRAVVGGMRKVIHKRLYKGNERELLALADPLFDWALSYRTPPHPLRVARRRGEAAGPGERGSPVERIIRAVATLCADKGYPNVTIAEIADRASTSQRTFYEHFANKEEAMLAALDAGSSRMLAEVLPAYRRADEWPHSIHGAIEALLGFGADDPVLTRLGAVDVYACGERALTQRDDIMEGLELLLAPGYKLAPETPAVAAEAIGGAIYALIYDQVCDKGPESLPELAPAATYVTLAPFLGAEGACEVACEGARRR